MRIASSEERTGDMTNDSPIGTSVADDVERKRSKDASYRDAAERLEPFEQLARVVIMRRAKLGLSQRDLAKRMGTTPSVISRIESGHHRTSTETIRRLAQALDGQAVLGFDFGTPSKPERELVAL
jgi:ribosome-binding protein aMBF1 (putative translation factor)